MSIGREIRDPSPPFPSPLPLLLPTSPLPIVSLPPHDSDHAKCAICVRHVKQETQLWLTNRETRLEVSQGHQTWYHSMLGTVSYYCPI